MEDTEGHDRSAESLEGQFLRIKRRTAQVGNRAGRGQQWPACANAPWMGLGQHGRIAPHTGGRGEEHRVPCY